jgi:plastocyanin
LVAVALLATVVSGLYPVGRNEHRVDVVNFAFEPRALTVAAGDRVVWSIRSGTHSVTSATDLWDSGAMQAAASYRQTFEMPGEFEYYCALHDFMRGSVAVEPTNPLRAIWFWSLSLLGAILVVLVARGWSKRRLRL